MKAKIDIKELFDCQDIPKDSIEEIRHNKRGISIMQKGGGTAIIPGTAEDVKELVKHLDFKGRVKIHRFTIGTRMIYLDN